MSLDSLEGGVAIEKRGIGRKRKAGYDQEQDCLWGVVFLSVNGE